MANFSKWRCERRCELLFYFKVSSILVLAIFQRLKLFLAKYESGQNWNYDYSSPPGSPHAGHTIGCNKQKAFVSGIHTEITFSFTHLYTHSIYLWSWIAWLYPAVLAQQEFFRDKADILLYLWQIFHPRVKAIFIDRGNMAAESSNIIRTGRLKSEATNTCLVLLQGLVTVTLILWFKTKQWEIAVHKHNTDK